MTKTEKKIQIVKQMLKSCVTSSTAAFYYGDIPRNRFNGAKRSYAYSAQYEDAIALIDTTFLGGGERGMVITLHDVYIKEMLSSPEHCNLSSIGELTMPRDTYYNPKNLCAMLSKLEEIENESEYDFFDAIGDIAGSILEESVKSFHSEYQKQRDEEDREALELLENVRGSIEEYRDGFDNLIVEYNDLETGDDVYSLILTATAYSCLLSDNYDKYKSILGDIYTGSTSLDEANQIIEATRALVELFDDLSLDDVDDVENISRTFKRFNSTMIKIVGEINSEFDDDDVDEINMEDYYIRTQKAIKFAKKKLNDLINYLNGEIENAYNEEDVFDDNDETEQNGELSSADKQYAYAIIVEEMGDFEEAFNYYLKAAKQGLVEAQYKLGECYYYGNGTEEDDKEAVKWYTKAAKNGHADSQFELGECYELGFGVEENEKQAIYWYTQAALQGHEEAIEALEDLQNK